MNKLELIIESILNEDEATAKALFHEFVVAKSRDIYESLMDEELGGNQAGQFVQDITNQNDQAQDMGLGEDDLEGGEIELGDDDQGDGFGDEETFGDDGEMGMGGEEGEHGEIEAKIDDLSAQLADLKAMLDGGGEDMGGDMGDMGGEEEMGGESDFDMDGGMSGSGKSASGMSGSGMSGSGKSASGKSGSASGFGGEEELEETWNFEKGSGKSGSGAASGKSGSGAASGSGMSGSGKSGSGKTEGYVRRTEAEIMKEYVDKIGEIYKQEPATGEGKTVGTGGDAPTVNSKSVSLDKGPDFGGESSNIVRGGSNENPDGKAFKAPSNQYSKGRGDLPGAGQFKNVPGGDAGKTSFKTKETAKKPEGSTTDGSVPVAKKSVQAQNTGRK